MKHTEVLKRAWTNLVSYKALWVFGIILALTTGGGGASGTSFYSFSDDDFRDDGSRLELDLQPGDDILEEIGEAFEREFAEAEEELDRFFEDVLETDITTDIVRILTTMLWIGVALFVVATFLRYISTAALIRMVDIHEETGEQMGFRKGFRLGFSRTAWRLFLIDLTFALPILVAFLSLFAGSIALIIMPWIYNDNGSVLLTVAGIGMFFLTILVAIVVSVVLGLLKPFFRRASALEELGVFASIRQGYQVVRQNLKDVGLMWLIMLGIALAWPILIVPVFLLVGLSGLVLGVLFGLMVGGFAGVIWGVVAGLIILALIVIIPLAFLEGLREVFNSSTWTVTYRELQAQGSFEPSEVIETETEAEVEDED